MIFSEEKNNPTIFYRSLGGLIYLNAVPAVIKVKIRRFWRKKNQLFWQKMLITDRSHKNNFYGTGPLIGTKQLKPYQLGTYVRGGKTYMKLGWGGGKAYIKLKSDERGEFDTFSKRGSALYETVRRGGASTIWSPKMMFRTMYVRFQLLGP